MCSERCARRRGDDNLQHFGFELKACFVMFEAQLDIQLDILLKKNMRHTLKENASCRRLPE